MYPKWKTSCVLSLILQTNCAFDGKQTLEASRLIVALDLYKGVQVYSWGNEIKSKYHDKESKVCSCPLEVLISYQGYL